MKDGYDAPRITVLGSFSELTLLNNKCGTASDVLTPQLQLVGSIVPVVCTVP